ncbi:lysozyme [Sulfuritortus calidifontis]|uniref:Lysozyme n=2 Tax=Sulfuritortus calidifontis TaxID=1914471 RepID=A0A4R3JRY1_9PROT|nr:lysozyme [Sulfuritortus calidifontis]
MIAVSAVAVAGIAVHEGYRARAYDDGVGVRTVGFGTTRREDGSPVRKSDTITPERAVLRLAKDADAIGRQIAACIGHVPLAQHEFDAYVSLAYNIGASAFCRSTIVKRLKQTPPDYSGACAAIKMWDKAGGRVLPGLVKRREAEYKQCLGAAQ